MPTTTEREGAAERIQGLDENATWAEVLEAVADAVIAGALPDPPVSVGENPPVEDADSRGRGG